jgi:hypothetical protein
MSATWQVRAHIAMSPVIDLLRQAAPAQSDSTRMIRRPVGSASCSGVHVTPGTVWTDRTSRSSVCTVTTLTSENAP